MSSNTSNNSISKKLDGDNVKFAQGLGKITDMDMGPDGDLYVLSKYLDTPTIFQISSANLSKTPWPWWDNFGGDSEQKICSTG